MRAILARNGFDVSIAPPCVKPDAATDCDLRCCSDRPDLLVLAVLVPRCCSGVEAAQNALRRWPDVRILLTSASPESMWPEKQVGLLGSIPKDAYAFLAKPFTARQLTAAVEELLGRSAEDGPD